MLCYKCKKEIEEGSIFCNGCGEKQEEIKSIEQPKIYFCFSCGKELSTGSALCDSCGEINYELARRKSETRTPPSTPQQLTYKQEQPLLYKTEQQLNTYQIKDVNSNIKILERRRKLSKAIKVFLSTFGIIIILLIGLSVLGLLISDDDLSTLPVLPDMKQTKSTTTTPKVTTTPPNTTTSQTTTTTKSTKTPNQNTSYQSIYDDYSKRIKNAAPGLVNDFNREATKLSGDIMALAELSNNKILELAEITNDGVIKMAELMYTINSNYNEYESWTNKLYDRSRKNYRCVFGSCNGSVLLLITTRDSKPARFYFYTKKSPLK